MVNIKNRLGKLIPPQLKRSLSTLREKREKTRLWLAYPFSRSKFFASVYYFVLNRTFNREHQAVLAGQAAYQDGLHQIGKSSTLLRRNIHRIEKGLVMQPRRDIFATDYIGETVDCYHRAVQTADLCENEMKWVSDVLTEYFSVVKVNEKIESARILFEKHKTQNNNNGKMFVPYLYKDMPDSTVSFEDLHRLFLKRRSVRWYQDISVPIPLIQKAIDIASLAPSACNRQPYRFFVSSSKEKAVAMAKLAGGTRGFAENLPCAIAVIGDLSAYSKERDRHLIYIDGSLAAMQLMLALETLGLSTCAINWPDEEYAEKNMQALLNLQLYERPIMLMAVGYARPDGGVPFSQKKQHDLLMKLV